MAVRHGYRHLRDVFGNGWLRHLLVSRVVRGLGRLAGRVPLHVLERQLHIHTETGLYMT
jgi:hypothetical protein